MKISDLLAMCVRNLARRKFRTFLTVVGVVIGTCAIIVMISLGIGMSASTDAMFEMWGDLTMLNVYSYSSEYPLDDDAVKAIEALEGVQAATPQVQLYHYNIDVWGDGSINGQVGIFAGKKNRYFNDSSYGITGVHPYALGNMGYTAQEGEMLPETDGKRIKVMFGEMVPYYFIDTKQRYPNNQVEYWNVDPETGERPDPFFDPMGETYLLRFPATEKKYEDLEYELELVGMIQGSGTNSYETQGRVYMDLKDMQRIVAEYKKANNIKDKNSSSNSTGYERLSVKLSDINLALDVEEAVRDMNFEAYGLASEREQMQQQARTMQMILGGLGFISLFVAAISITNTMIMSVYERTREIGVMKVLGCLVHNIRSIFLVEAGLIGFFGGVLGVGISYVISFAMNTFGGALGNIFGNSYGYMEEGAQVSIIPPWLILLGMAFATLIGLVSGFYPANRAVRISALEAIRQE